MKTAKCDPKKFYAAQNAKEGLISVADLSLLTGIATSQLTSFAKTGQLNHYGEYHGKRFYNFEEVVKWAITTETDDAAKTALRNGMETEQKGKGCPYSIEKVTNKTGDTQGVKVIWKEIEE